MALDIKRMMAGSLISRMIATESCSGNGLDRGFGLFR